MTIDPKLRMKHYVLQILLAIDQLFNALLFGWADETLSARAFRAERDGRFFGRITRPLIDTIFVALTLGRESDHCMRAHLSEVMRQQNHPAYRAP